MGWGAVWNFSQWWQLGTFLLGKQIDNHSHHLRHPAASAVFYSVLSDHNMLLIHWIGPHEGMLNHVEDGNFDEDVEDEGVFN